MKRKKKTADLLIEYEAQLELAVRDQNDIAARANDRRERAVWHYRCGCVDGLWMALQMLYDLIDTQPKGGDAECVTVATMIDGEQIEMITIPDSDS